MVSTPSAIVSIPGQVHALLAECHDMEVAALKRQQSPRAQVQSPLSVRQVHLPKDRCEECACSFAAACRAQVQI